MHALNNIANTMMDFRLQSTEIRRPLSIVNSCRTSSDISDSSSLVDGSGNTPMLVSQWYPPTSSEGSGSRGSNSRAGSVHSSSFFSPSDSNATAIGDAFSGAENHNMQFLLRQLEGARRLVDCHCCESDSRVVEKDSVGGGERVAEERDCYHHKVTLNPHKSNSDNNNSSSSNLTATPKQLATTVATTAPLYHFHNNYTSQLHQYPSPKSRRYSLQDQRQGYLFSSTFSSSSTSSPSCSALSLARKHQQQQRIVHRPRRSDQLLPARQRHLSLTIANTPWLLYEPHSLQHQQQLLLQQQQQQQQQISDRVAPSSVNPMLSQPNPALDSVYLSPVSSASTSTESLDNSQQHSIRVDAPRTLATLPSESLKPQQQRQQQQPRQQRQYYHHHQISIGSIPRQAAEPPHRHQAQGPIPEPEAIVRNNSQADFVWPEPVTCLLSPPNSQSRVLVEQQQLQLQHPRLQQQPSPLPSPPLDDPRQPQQREQEPRLERSGLPLQEQQRRESQRREQGEATARTAIVAGPVAPAVAPAAATLAVATSSSAHSFRDSLRPPSVPPPSYQERDPLQRRSLPSYGPMDFLRRLMRFTRRRTRTSTSIAVPITEGLATTSNAPTGPTVIVSAPAAVPTLRVETSSPSTAVPIPTAAETTSAPSVMSTPTTPFPTAITERPQRSSRSLGNGFYPTLLFPSLSCSAPPPTTITAATTSSAAIEQAQQAQQHQRPPPAFASTLSIASTSVPVSASVAAPPQGTSSIAYAPNSFGTFGPSPMSSPPAPTLSISAANPSTRPRRWTGIIGSTGSSQHAANTTISSTISDDSSTTPRVNSCCSPWVQHQQRQLGQHHRQSRHGWWCTRTSRRHRQRQQQQRRRQTSPWHWLSCRSATWSGSEREGDDNHEDHDNNAHNHANSVNNNSTSSGSQPNNQNQNHSNNRQEESESENRQSFWPFYFHRSQPLPPPLPSQPSIRGAGGASLRMSETLALAPIMSIATTGTRPESHVEPQGLTSAVMMARVIHG